RAVAAKPVVPVAADRTRFLELTKPDAVPARDGVAVAELAEVARRQRQLEPPSPRLPRLLVAQLPLQVVLHGIEREDREVGTADPKRRLGSVRRRPLCELGVGERRRRLRPA